LEEERRERGDERRGEERREERREEGEPAVSYTAPVKSRSDTGQQALVSFYE